MTNKEKFKEVFGLEIDDTSDCGFFDCTDRTCKDCPVKDTENWWNMEYKDPTARNCFGCKYSKDNHIAGTEECHLCMWKNQYTPTIKNNLGVDCVSRQEVDRLACRYLKEPTDNHVAFYEDFLDLNSVTPQESKCKDCKWWKDSDGEYRRGCGAESQCPINRREVFEGNGYCYLFEPQESEVEDGNDD